MIAFLRGNVLEITDDGIIVEAGNVGLLVNIPYAMTNPRPELGQEISLHTYLQVKEDGWQLFGFSNKEQLAVFKLLLNVSGIGARTALAIIDHLHPATIAGAVSAGDSNAFTAVSGVGKKTADRLLLELKDKIDTLNIEGNTPPPAPKEAQLRDDLLNALKQLGYTAAESRAFARRAQEKLGDDEEEEVLLREALRIAMRS